MKQYLGMDRCGSVISDREPALTRKQALNRVREIMESHEESLFAAITGIGTFQVYVTIYKRAV